MSKVIRYFQDDYSFLSNFYPSKIHAYGLSFPTVEHAFQAFKCESIDDFLLVSSADSPGEAKKLGRKALMRKDWEEIKYVTMKTLLKIKFSNARLKKKLLATGNARLVEGNNWGDDIWGMVKKKGKWVGENRLGVLLMEIREEFASTPKIKRRKRK